MLALIEIKLLNSWLAVCLILWRNHSKEKFYLMLEHTLVFFFLMRVCELKQSKHHCRVWIFTYQLLCLQSAPFGILRPKVELNIFENSMAAIFFFFFGQYWQQTKL